jgi:hypothetical protein
MWTSDTSSSGVPFERGSGYIAIEHRSTVDAVNRVRVVFGAMVFRRGVALAVSMDIMRSNSGGPYILRGASLSYSLSSSSSYSSGPSVKWVGYTGKDEEGRRPIERSVRQGSILGLTFWINSYDAVLHCPLRRTWTWCVTPMTRCLW